MTRTLALLLFFTLSAAAQRPSSVLGTWREPTGSVIEVARCGSDLCARLVSISAHAASTVDIHNPDPKSRTHPLCGLQIGYGFHLSDPAHADGGHLYDPKSGKTYKGSMEAEGNSLDLRGYIGLKVFGRTETWTRTARPPAPCTK